MGGKELNAGAGAVTNEISTSMASSAGEGGSSGG